MKSKFEIFLDTDILSEHLAKGSSGDESLLSKCLNMFDGCYTSVINASEIFSKFKNKGQTDKAKSLFNEVSILGIPFRYSLKIGEVLEIIKKKIPETLYVMP
ncbi:MAG: hypothetical protein ABI792_09305 [bacterium]